jgi:hypothetical protein
MNSRRHVLLLAGLGWAALLCSNEVPLSTADAQTVQAPGGFLEKAGTTMRSRWSNSQVQSFVPPDRGKFLFPAPYNTQGVRLTSPTDCQHRLSLVRRVLLLAEYQQPCGQ